MQLPPDHVDHTASRADLGDGYAATEPPRGAQPAIVSGQPVAGLLEPGDRRIRSVLRPAFGSTHARTAHWTCTRCGAAHRITATWAVLLYDARSTVPRACMVCPSCADLLLPYRFHVDPRRTHEVPRRTAAARATIDLVERIDAARGGDGSAPLCIRSADVIALAGDLGVDRGDLALDLLDLGLVVSTSRGTHPVRTSGAAH